MTVLGSLLMVTICCQFCTLTVSYSVGFRQCNSAPSSDETFMYFAYGSNMLSKRIHQQNPTAIRRGIGKLRDYRLDFNLQWRDWNGSIATIVEDHGRHVWGAIWEIGRVNMKDLDRQEGVDKQIYKPLTLNVETPTGQQINCRVYELVNNPDVAYRFEDLPICRRPSRTYLNCILNGAKESRLPFKYIKDLKRIPHNNRDVNDPTRRELCEISSCTGTNELLPSDPVKFRGLARKNRKRFGTK